MSDKRRTYEIRVPGEDSPRTVTDERTPEQVARDVFEWHLEAATKIIHSPLDGAAEFAKWAAPELWAVHEAPHDFDSPLPSHLDDALQRILDATTAAGGKLIPDFTERRRLWGSIALIFMYWLPGAKAADDRAAARATARRHKRIISAALAIKRELRDYHYPRGAELAKEIYHLLSAVTSAPEISPVEEVDILELFGPGSVLERLVGMLYRQFERTFRGSPRYATDPVSGETDGPFIRFVEQAMREFGVTRDGNQPYQRRSIAAALNDHKKRVKRKTAQPKKTSS
jgi:hypothetical protein